VVATGRLDQSRWCVVTATLRWGQIEPGVAPCLLKPLWLMMYTVSSVRKAVLCLHKDNVSNATQQMCLNLCRALLCLCMMTQGMPQS
jgi:hypothetical protein